MKYSEYIANTRDRFWQSDKAIYINDKREGKNLARSLGIPCPADYTNVVIKPTNSYGGRGVQMLPHCENLMCEEYIPHEYDYRLFTFDSVPLLQIDRCVQKNGHTQISEVTYWTTDKWEQVFIDKKFNDVGVVNRPDCLDIMIDYALRVRKAMGVPVRVDFLVSDQPMFGELCFTPGLIVGGRITEEADIWLGSYINDE